MSLKITLIGAGSVVFAKNLIGDILQFPELSNCTLCLMDVDPARVKVAGIMANRMIEALGVKAKAVTTLSQKEAIKDAKYVICTIQVGGYKPGTVIDFEIPRKYGLLQTIGDTLGVGGVFRALRTIPVMTSIAQDIADIGAPGCILLNYSNPMAMNCMAVARATGIPHIGLCHSVQGTSHQLANYLGLPMKDITYLVAGINHMAFFLKFEYRHQDAYPLLFKLINDPDFSRDRVRFEMMRRTGYFVTESSEHQSEYVPYFIHHGKKLIEQFDVPIDEYLRRCESGFRSWKHTEADLLGTKGSIAIKPQSNEYGAFIIHSCETNTPRVVYGNVPNTSLIENLPAAACVEVPCLIDAQGIQPTHIGKLPPQLAAICQTNINVQDLTVEAALTNKREHIYHAVMLDPHAAATLPLDKIWAMCDDLIAAHQKHGLLGEFAPTIANTGRSFAGTGDRVLAEVDVVPSKAGKLEAEVKITNPRKKPFKVDLTVECEGEVWGASAGRSIPLKVQVPAGKTVRKKIAMPKADAAKEGFALRLSSSSADVFAREFISQKRLVLSAGKKGGASFELKLAGFHAADGSISVAKNVISLSFAVEDTKLVPCPPRPWEGSGIELFFTSLRGGNIRQLFLVPKANGRQVTAYDSSLKPVAGITTKMGPNTKGLGYIMNIEIPFAAAGLKKDDTSFLFNTIVNVSTLSNAHDGGRTSLSGQFDSHENSNRFAQVES
jgi:alpha-galactosidase